MDNRLYDKKTIFRQIADGDIQPLDEKHEVSQHGMEIARKISEKCEKKSTVRLYFMDLTSRALKADDQRPAERSFEPVPEWLVVMNYLKDEKIIPDNKYSYEDLWDGIVITWEYQMDQLKIRFGDE